MSRTWTYFIYIIIVALGMMVSFLIDGEIRINMAIDHLWGALMGLSLHWSLNK